MKEFNIIIEAHRAVKAEHEDDAHEQAQRLAASIEAHCGDVSVYIESVEEA